VMLPSLLWCWRAPLLLDMYFGVGAKAVMYHCNIFYCIGLLLKVHSNCYWSGNTGHSIWKCKVCWYIEKSVFKRLAGYVAQIVEGGNFRDQKRNGRIVLKRMLEWNWFRIMSTSRPWCYIVETLGCHQLVS
jgi:Zn-finger protein